MPRAVAERAAKLIITLPFQAAALYTRWSEWKIEESEWQRIKDPATNLVERYFPHKAAERIVAGSDLLALGDGLLSIYLDRKARYELAKAEAESKANDIINQRNGQAPHVDVSPVAWSEHFNVS